MSRRKTYTQQQPPKTQPRSQVELLARVRASPDITPAAREALPNQEGSEAVPDAVLERIKTLDECINILECRTQDLANEKERQQQESHDLQQRQDHCTQREKRLGEREAQLVSRDSAISQREEDAKTGFLNQNRKVLETLKEAIGQLQAERDERIARIEQDERDARMRIDEARKDWLNEHRQARQTLVDERAQLNSERVQLDRDNQRLALAQTNLKSLEAQIRREVDEEKCREVAELNRCIERLTRHTQEDAGELQRQRDALAAYEDLDRLLQRVGLDGPEHLLKEYQRLIEDNRRLREAERTRPTADLEEEVETLRNRCDEYEQQLEGQVQQIGKLRNELATRRVSTVEKFTLSQENRVLKAHTTALNSAVDDLERRLTDLTDSQQGNETFPALSAMDREPSSIGAADQTPDLASFAKELRASIVNATDTKLFYSETIIRLFLGGLAMSQLHILQGISGTGKTSLPIAFAKAVGGHCTVVPVQAGWRDRDDLFGHFNAFERRFYERDCLQAIYRAGTANWCDRINIILLDEMNLSHPEQYFADVLSALERPQGERKIVLSETAHAKRPVLLSDGRFLTIPPNLWFIGTANQDETTKGFADKTIDRAHVMQLPRSEDPFTPGQTPERLPFSVESLHKQFDKAIKQYRAQVEEALKAIYQSPFSKSLEKSFDLGWGNRLERQAKRFVPVVIAAGGSQGEAFDHLLATRLFRPGKVTDRYDIDVDTLRNLERELANLWRRVDSKNVEPVACLERLQREIIRKEQQG